MRYLLALLITFAFAFSASAQKFHKGETMKVVVDGPPSGINKIFVETKSGDLIPCSASQGNWFKYFQKLDYDSYYITAVMEITDVWGREGAWRYRGHVSSPAVAQR